MKTRRKRPRFLPSPLDLVPLAIAALTLAPATTHAAFHLMEFSRVMTGWNGDATIQAVELRMQTSGQNFLSGGQIKAYDAAGSLLGTLGTFPGNVANGATDARVLCATAAFQATFGITADLTITPGLPVGTGQVSFEEAGCFVNAIAYGAVTVPKNGTTSAAAVPSGLAYVLVRTVNNSTFPSCPLGEDAAARMTLRSGSASAPVVFRNNAGVSVNVFSTVTGVEASPVTAPFAIVPNPVRSDARVTAPGGGRLTIHDARGRLVRVLAGAAHAGVVQAAWDGRDHDGRTVASGVYFLRHAGPAGSVVRRFVVAR